MAVLTFIYACDYKYRQSSLARRYWPYFGNSFTKYCRVTDSQPLTNLPRAHLIRMSALWKST
jgi:hypothetical protein